MVWVLTPPNRLIPSVIAPFRSVADGYKKPDNDPANRNRSGWNAANVSAAMPPCETPTYPCPPGAKPLLAASQSGSSRDRNVAHCLLPSDSQSVYMLHALPAGAATEMPLPASVLIALPDVTQLLISGAASNALSSKALITNNSHSSARPPCELSAIR